MPIVSRLERFWAVWSDNEQILPRDRRDWELSLWPWPGTGAGLGTGSSGACRDWALSPSLVHGTASPQSRTLCGLVVVTVVAAMMVAVVAVAMVVAVMAAVGESGGGESSGDAESKSLH